MNSDGVLTSLRHLCLGLLAAVPAFAANPLAQFRTTFGTLEVELLRDRRPESVANFIRYVESGRYRDGFAHRLVPNYLLAGGCYGVTNRGLADANYSAVSPFPPIPNEVKLGGVITNRFGTLAFGSVDPQSRPLASEFFFSLSDASGPFFTKYQGGFPVFGEIRGGLEVLQKINNSFKAQRTIQVATNALISIFDSVLPDYLYGTTQFPVTIFNPTYEFSDQLEHVLFLDITLLNVAILPATDGGVAIVWDSVAGRPNVVEFTRTIPPNSPPNWETLGRVTGTGARMTLVDRSVGAERFHRVRVEY